MNFSSINILIVVYGCLSRSLNITHQNHQNQIFNVFKSRGITYSTCYINNHVNEIDGIVVKPFDVPSVSADHYITITQKHIDEKIFQQYPNFNKFFRNIPGKKSYIDTFGINPLRNSFIETMASNFIKSNHKKYSHCLAFCADNWFGDPIHLNYINDDHLIVSDQNPASGYTNGFYFGECKLVSQLINTFNNLGSDAIHDFEYLLKCNAQRHKISILEEKYRFLKIRSSGIPAYFELKGIAKRWSRVEHILSEYLLATQK